MTAKRDRGEYRPIYEVLLDGPEWKQLPADARLVFLALKLKCGGIGIKVVSGLVGSLAEWTGLSPRRVGVATKALTEAGWIEREDTVVWVVRGLEFEPTMDVRNANHRKYVARSLNALPSLQIVDRFRARYMEWVGDAIPHPIPEAIPHAPPITSTSTSTTPTPNYPSNNGGAIAAFLELVPSSQRRTWEALLSGWREGQGYVAGRRAADEDIAQGLTEYLAANLTPDFTPKHVVAYVRKAEERRTAPTKASSFLEVA